MRIVISILMAVRTLEHKVWALVVYFTHVYKVDTQPVLSKSRQFKYRRHYSAGTTPLFENLISFDLIMTCHPKDMQTGLSRTF
jgi:hypothetical protein